MRTECHLVLLKEDAVWRRYRAPLRTYTARTAEDVPELLLALSNDIAHGKHAAGYLAYEAAPAFDTALCVHPPGPLPVAWFGIYEAPELIAAMDIPQPGEHCDYSWRCETTPDAYQQSFNKIKCHIAAGDTYQVNYTVRLHNGKRIDPWAFFLANINPSDAPYAAWLDLGEFAIASASPELFFRQEGNMVTCRPMKGTIGRGRVLSEDAERRNMLEKSTKDRAENVMIVDMIRNDLGRIAYPGTVHVSSLFDIETYYTAHQMTSTIIAQSGHDPVEVLSALFPCASITGAPKVRTMKLIKELEPSPRGVYTGAIGYFAPGRRARFSVAIRTLSADRSTGKAEYGTGGGIVWDSKDTEEWEECRVKANVLHGPPPRFRLLETMLYMPGQGFWLEQRHLDRLFASAEYFGFRLDKNALLEGWHRFENQEPARVRLMVAADGAVEWQSFPLKEDPRDRPQMRTVVLDDQPVDAGDRFLYHKTTMRSRYNDALERYPDADDVLLWNTRGECTESCLANLVWEEGGCHWTPNIDCGLLDGTLRRELLQTGMLQESRLQVGDLPHVQRLWLINSVQGWMPVRIPQP